MYVLNIDKLIDDGKNLEIFTASYFQSLGYYIESNLKWIEDKEDKEGNIDVLELDVLAKKFMNNSIDTILIECKRGCTFNDFFKFAGVAQLVKADENIMVCQSNHEQDIKKMGLSMGIKILLPKDMANNVIADMQTCKLLLIYFTSNQISNSMLDKEKIKSIISPNSSFTKSENLAYNKIRKYMAYLIGKIWRNHNLIDQANEIKELLDAQPDFIRKITRILKLAPGNKSSEYYMKRCPICQAAGYLVLKIRMSYIICAVQCAYNAKKEEFLYKENINNISFIKVVEVLSEDIQLALQIPYFLQSFIYIFGGVISLVGDTDIKNIAKYLKIENHKVDKIIELLKKLFLIGETHIQWGFVEDMGVLSLKYIPYPLKGIGMINREELGFPTKSFTFKKEWIDSLKNYNYQGGKYETTRKM